MLQNEKVLTFSEATRALPPVNGKRPHSSTIWRWARKGVQGVRLETRRLGGKFVTSVEALERFAKALAEVDVPERSPIPNAGRGSTQKQFERERAEANAQLNAAGI